MKTFDTKDPKMAAYSSTVRQLKGKFDGIDLHHVKHSGNVAADTLARMGAAREPVPTKTLLEHLHKPSVRLGAELKVAPASADPGAMENEQQAETEVPADMALAVIPALTQPILTYLANRELLEDRNEVRRIVFRSKAYTIIQGSSTNAASPTSSIGASRPRTEGKCCKKSMRGLAAITRLQGR